jgi:zinc transport system permease protein
MTHRSRKMAANARGAVPIIEYLSNTAFAANFWPGVASTLVIALLGGSLSWLVVVKRLSFIGQGVSHSAFGGVGLALVLGLSGATLAGGLSTMGVVLAFSLLAAFGIAMLSGVRSSRADTAIGIVLSVSMAIGFLLYHLAETHAQDSGHPPPPELEEILFGSITLIEATDFWVALATALLVLGVLWAKRHQILFWMFDEAVAPAFGVPVMHIRLLVMTLLTLVVVVTMKLAGIVLVSAVLVLPGAIALQLTDRLSRAVALSIIASVTASILGLIAAFEFGILPGPTIVLVLGLLYAGAWIPRRLQKTGTRHSGMKA